ncbi:MAG: hypothetical protein MN733_29560, partial [Nitrososphaera sp.]|nr:hypothetical protein [Nitrososphaera sp.]
MKRIGAQKVVFGLLLAVTVALGLASWLYFTSTSYAIGKLEAVRTSTDERRAFECIHALSPRFILTLWGTEGRQIPFADYRKEKTPIVVRFEWKRASYDHRLISLENLPLLL